MEERRDDIPTWRICETLCAKNNIKEHSENSKEKVIVKKGDMAIIGFDKRLHHYNGTTFGLDKETVELEGYCASGLASYLCEQLKRKMPLDDMLEGFDVSETNLIDDITFILVELGMSE